MVYKGLNFYLTVVLCVVCFAVPVSAQSEFPDLPEGHWAYASVMSLVDNGTVRGFDDGEFKPDKTVSRAEFVKMLGKGEQKRQSDFSDVNSSHWAYDYVIYSQLEGKGNDFLPDTAILRDDCLGLIWKRNQSPKDTVAPSVITSQSENKDAAAWGYTYGIMIGDDGLNLRLKDSLTRAEAAVLITRAKDLAKSAEKNSFLNTVSDKTLETIFNSTGLFADTVYDKDKTFTNGEMARAALTLGLDTSNITYKQLPETLSNHKYAKDFYTVFKECITSGEADESLIDAPATMQDTLVAMVYNAIKSSHKPVKYGSIDKHYSDVVKVDSPMANVCVTYGFENGIRFTADNNLNAQQPATHRQFACLMLQLDSIIGLKTDYVIRGKNEEITFENAKINNELTSYPSNASEYRYILEGLPNEIYQTPFAQNVGIPPKTVFDFSKEYALIFTNLLDEFKSKIEKETKAVINFTFYPSLVCQNDNGATLRVKCEVQSNEENALMRQIFNNDSLPADIAAEGMVFYADIVTGQQINDVYLIADKASAGQILYTEANR